MGRPVRIANDAGVPLVVGTTEGAYFEYVTADPGLHRYHANPGWAKDAAALEEAVARGCLYYRVRVVAAGRPRRTLAIDTTPIDAMFAYGRRIQYGAHRVQIQLPFATGRWERRVVDPSHATPAPPPAHTAPQLELGLEVETAPRNVRGLH